MFLHPYVPTLLFICRPPISCLSIFFAIPSTIFIETDLKFLPCQGGYVFSSVSLSVSVSKITLEKSYEQIAMKLWRGLGWYHEELIKFWLQSVSSLFFSICVF